ncbi:hypothetical protein DSL72_004976 [Monilinia vaccinii-corymbosi]|uniref:Uncharacterized protein n=1 Tax=Monilinia vaccinii-corymbosi TaxID=61207 RepID=A0A8A3PE52_9HELO|nr:hypothetical protein DSL72_004976 [Monilinia vaccinii-corymbosi]
MSKYQSPPDSPQLPPTKAPLPPFGQPGNQGKSALLRENFLCNIADAMVPLGLFPSHSSHRIDTPYKTGNFKRADVDAELADDDWVNLTDHTTTSGPMKITARAVGSRGEGAGSGGSVREEVGGTPSRFDRAKMKVSARSFGRANVAWAINQDTDMSPAMVGEPDDSMFVLRRYDIRDPAQVQKKRLELNIDGFDWDDEEHVARLNRARRSWEMLTLESNPQTSGKSRVTVDGRRSPVDTFVGSWSPSGDDVEEA